MEPRQFLLVDGTQPHRPRGRPRSNWPERPPVVAKSQSSAAIIDTALQLSSETTQAYYRLQHHLSWTGDTKGVSSRRDIIQRINNLDLELPYSFILDLVCSIVTFHLSLLDPDRQAYFQDLAESFRSSGIHNLARMLSSVDGDHGRALFAASVLVCITTLAKGPYQGDFLLFSDTGLPSLFELLQGPRAIVARLGIENAFSGPLRKFSCSGVKVQEPVMVHVNIPHLHWSDQLDRLEQFIIDARSTDCQSDLKALASLRVCYEATWGRSDGTYTGEAIYQLPFIWICHLDSEFADRLRNKSPIPLIVFAYFSVLLKVLGHIWFVNGWPQYILSGIKGVVDPVYLDWLEWPAQALYRPWQTPDH